MNQYCECVTPGEGANGTQPYLDPAGGTGTDQVMTMNILHPPRVAMSPFARNRVKNVIVDILSFDSKRFICPLVFICGPAGAKAFETSNLTLRLSHEGACVTLMEGKAVSPYSNPFAALHLAWIKKFLEMRICLSSTRPLATCIHFWYSNGCIATSSVSTVANNKGNIWRRKKN